jgi:hypothetical protein
VPRCPIRFLDQQSPEEVAKYFEVHRHEIPRSHEACVKRWQTNQESIRQLDEKYGNLVNMLQGLGAKHKPLLPSEPGQAGERESAEKIEKWAEDCTGDPAPGSLAAEQPSEVRSGHFERPLREIRVGESPSRPWGISVPQADGLAPSTASVEAGRGTEHEIARSTEPASSPSCPLPDALAPADGAERPPPVARRPPADAVSEASKPSAAPSGPIFDAGLRAIDREHDRVPARPQPSAELGDVGNDPQPARMVFTGPVFFGYSADEASKLLKQLP